VATEKRHRSTTRARRGEVEHNKPYGDKSLIGWAFNRATSREGVPISVLKKKAEERKKAKTPAFWIITDLRRGKWKTAAGTWTWDADEKDGMLKIRNVQLNAKHKKSSSASEQFSS